MEVLKQSRKLKGTNIYINYHLTCKNNDIATKARLLLNQSKISRVFYYYYLCKVFIKTNGVPEVAGTFKFRKMSDIDLYVRLYLRLILQRVCS